MKRRTTSIWGCAVSAAVLLAGLQPALAETPAEFYKGKDIRVLIGSGVGGTYGLYGLLAARHMRKHVPGNPNMALQSMPGGGGMNALNFSYNVAPKDGTVMHLVHAEVLFESLINPKANFNAKNYQWIGRLSDADYIGLASRRSGAKTLEDAKKREIVMGATGARAVGAVGPRLFNRAAGTKFRVIAGWKGTADIMIAMERGEVDGLALSWANTMAIHKPALDKGDLVPVFAIAESRLAALPKVPTITEFGTNEDEKTFLSLYTSVGTMGRSLAFPPGVPKDRVDAMRTAFQKMLKDPEFLEEVKSRGILLSPKSGDELRAYVDKHMASPPARVDAWRKIYAQLLAEGAAAKGKGKK